MLGSQDSLSPRITPTFLAVSEGNTLTSSTVTDRSMRRQSFPGMKDFSYTNIELEVEAAVPAEMSAKHSEMGVATWVLVEDML